MKKKIKTKRTIAFCRQTPLRLAFLLAGLCTLPVLSACASYALEPASRTRWKSRYDLSLPNLSHAGRGREAANADGWYQTLSEDFDGDTLPEPWCHVENGIRNEAYWCDTLLACNGGMAVIKAERQSDHRCPHPGCGSRFNAFTSGIVTCNASDTRGEPTFSQAFGYFEVRCQVPYSDGMWGAFWLQTPSIGQIGNGGKDGSEIDIFESNFFRRPFHVGSAVHYDGYGPAHRSLGSVHSVPTDTYRGFHTYALKWTPHEYVFYYDGQPSWATDFGGICRVPAYLLLTCEIRDRGISGPYGDAMGSFTGGAFSIDSVRVYQNRTFEPFIQRPEDYKQHR